MDQTTANSYNFGHGFYRKYIQEDENMKARIKAILNQVHENRVAIKELHADFGTKYSEVINSYKNRLEDNTNHYGALMNDLHSRQEKILEMCNKASNNV